MNKYQLKIINSLVKKYEKSLLSLNQNKVNIKIKVVVNKIFKNYYNFDNYEETQLIDEAIISLSKLGLIEVDNADSVNEIILNNNNVDKLYQIINKTMPLKVELDKLNFFEIFELKYPALKEFNQAIIIKYQRRISLSRYFDIDNDIEINNIYFALARLINNDKEYTIRSYSILLFSDSKYLENISSKINNILKDYFDNTNLENYNIIKNPHPIYIKGSIIFKINDQVINLNKLNGTYVILSNQLDDMEIIELSDTKLLSIENMTSFFDTNLDNTLHLYLAGFNNKAKVKFIKLVNDFKKILYYHFGDIDAGGLYIYQHLKESTAIDFKMVAMDVATLKTYKEYTKSLSNNDLNRLTKLKSKLNLSVIDYMIDNNVKLEQEIISLDNNDLN